MSEFPAIYQVTTRGDEVYESETGPTIGYDNIQSYPVVIHDFEGLLHYAENAEQYESCKRMCGISAEWAEAVGNYARVKEALALLVDAVNAPDTPAREGILRMRTGEAELALADATK